MWRGEPNGDFSDGISPSCLRDRGEATPLNIAGSPALYGGNSAHIPLLGGQGPMSRTPLMCSFLSHIP